MSFAEVSNHKKVAPQTRELATDDNVILANLFEEVAELPFGIVLCATDSLLNPIIDLKVLFLAKIIDFKSLVFNSLLVTTYSNLTVNHIQIELKIL